MWSVNHVICHQFHSSELMIDPDHHFFLFIYFNERLEGDVKKFKNKM